MKKLVMLLALIGICSSLAVHADEYIRKEEVENLILRSKVWFPTNPEDKDMIAGPESENAFGFMETITCTYKDETIGGKTPKFLCVNQANGEVIKVKYKQKNRELYGEIIGSRLVWALGFGYDNNYSTVVRCIGCPDRLAKHGERLSDGIIVFNPATVEIRNNRNQIEYEKDSGWRWDYHLLKIDPRKGGATRAEVDAFRLLGVFMYHWDHKPANQRMVCLDEEVSNLADCKVPFLMIHDFGSTFGGPFNLFEFDIYANKVSLKDWKKRTIWKSKTKCEIGMRSDYPPIREAGRALLASQMSRLSDQQIIDLFNAARIEMLEEKIRVDGQERIATAEDWAKVFKEKRDLIVNHRCSN